MSYTIYKLLINTSSSSPTAVSYFHVVKSYYAAAHKGSLIHCQRHQHLLSWNWTPQKVVEVAWFMQIKLWARSILVMLGLQLQYFSCQTNWLKPPKYWSSMHHCHQMNFISRLWKNKKRLPALRHVEYKNLSPKKWIFFFYTGRYRTSPGKYWLTKR